MVVFVVVNPWTVALVVGAVIAIAGASGAFDQSEVNEDDYDEDGIYIPPVVLPNPYVEPTPYVNPNPNPDETPDEYEYPKPNVDPDADSEKNKTLFPLPYGYVNVYMTQSGGDDFDPDFDIPDDVRPPSSSFTVGAEAYDSGLGYIIAAIMADILAFWLVTICTERDKE